ncbi:16130_t:CDS:2 [Funneliformis caledonium]|uniref:16130_t:CDS:1 n=1 Tax=Funneliformis caledonium TaxID=1117310 RepID=A0A9N8VW74_9GLOM|nr:16130_t:CDS:2 [Funneliformis caledonium]
MESARIEPKDFSPQIINGEDLVKYIPGLYRLLDLHKDDDSNGLSKKTMRKSISEINYTKLNSISVRLIGCYGNRHLIAKLLLNLEIINQQIYELLIVSHTSFDYSNKPFLRPGIYLLVVNPDFSLVIHWPEVGCYEENSPSQCKKNMTNLHRYLTKVTEHQLCHMSDEDLESFDWNLYNTDVDSDDDKRVDLFDNIKTEIQNTQEDGVPLHPIVIESATNKSFATRKLTKKTSCMRELIIAINEWEFSQKLQSSLKERRLYIDRRTMDMKSLEILIIHGLKMEDELLGLFRRKQES